jgi:hypothetical protein
MRQSQRFGAFDRQLKMDDLDFGVIKLLNHDLLRMKKELPLLPL